MIFALSSTAARFGGLSDGEADKPIVQTVDAADAPTYVALLFIRRTFPLSQHNPTPPGNYALSWRAGGRATARQVNVMYKPSTNLRPDFVLRFFYGVTDVTPNVFHPQRDFPPGMQAWPNNHPNVVVSGNGGGRFFTLWCHGRQGMRQEVSFLLIKGTRNMFHMYHVHLQQQDSRNMMEIRDAQRVAVYGTKGEHKGSQIYVRNSRQVRIVGHGGLGSPDAAYNPPYLFQVHDSDDFSIAGIGDFINEHTTRWVDGIYDKWIFANVLTFHVLRDVSAARGVEVVPPSNERPILYVVGNPTFPMLPVGNTPVQEPSPSASPVAVAPSASTSPATTPSMTPTTTPSITPTTTSPTTATASPTTSATSPPSPPPLPIATPSVTPAMTVQSGPLPITTVSVGNLARGVGFSDSVAAARSPWYVMYSATSIQARFPSSTFNPNAAEHLIGVRYDAPSSKWVLDTAVFPEPADAELEFTPVPTDRLLARVDFAESVLVPLDETYTGQKMMGINIRYGTGDLTFHLNMWNGGPNDYEVWVQGTQFTTGGSSPDASGRVMVGPLQKGVAFTDSLVSNTPGP